MVKKTNLKNSNDFVNKAIIAFALIIAFLIIAITALAFIVLPFYDGFAASGIAVIPIKGEITNVSGGAFDSTLTALDVVELIEDAENNPSVAAIFLDIDSPGGEVVASKQIVYKVRSSSKPVYSYINSLGTSGAYYIAASTDYIMADEDSITGSIGVISIFFNFQELLDELGIKVNIVKEGEFKAIGSPFKDLSEEEKEIIQTLLKDVHEGFKDDVLEFRNGKLTRGELERLADGRIMSGRQAFQSNLVDELMSRDEAIVKAAELAGITDHILIHYGKEKIGLGDLIFASGKAFGQGMMSSFRIGDSVQIR